MIKKAVAALAAGAVLAGSAQAGCWQIEEASAAGVRELQSMLMVAALRCLVSGHPLMVEYNGFVASNREAIGRVNDRLKAHFIRAHGPVQGQRAYDAFTTSMANGYGAAASGAEVCGSAASLAREAALMANSLEGLALIVERQGIAARLPDGLCQVEAPLTVASAETVIAVAER
jgi:hypothetical protein